MDFIIWGAGTWGKRCANFLGEERIVAFIDSDLEKIGTRIKGKKIISFAEYKKKYINKVIIVSPIKSDEIIEKLEINNIEWYLRFDECPSEIILPNRETDYIRNIPYKLKKENNYLLGLNPYSLYIYDIAKGNNKNVKIIAEKKISASKIKKIKELLNVEIEKSINNIDINNSDIFMASPYNEDFDNNIKKLVTNEIYNFKEVIKSYKNSKIEIFKNKHKGKRIFVVATGPSLKKEDLEKLYKNNEICISMNRIFEIFNTTRWRPNYYVLADEFVYRQVKDLIKKEKTINCFLSDISGYKDDNSNNKYIWHLCKTKNNNLELFAKDISTGIGCIGTVTYACIQLAAYLGASKIYLLGTDFTFSKNANENGQHFYKEKELIINPYVSYKYGVYNSYISAKYYSEKYGFQIFNATRGGKLEVFPRVDFDSLFRTNE